MTPEYRILMEMRMFQKSGVMETEAAIQALWAEICRFHGVYNSDEFGKSRRALASGRPHDPDELATAQIVRAFTDDETKVDFPYEDPQYPVITAIAMHIHGRLDNEHIESDYPKAIEWAKSAHSAKFNNTTK